MKEFHKNGRPVWRKRNSEHKPEAHKRYVRSLIEALEKLETETRPSGGDKTAAGKDLAAFRALETAGNLVDALAGWALDHQIGLALNRLEFLPLGPTKTRALPEYVEAKRQVDSHNHEREGGAVFSGVAPERLTSTIARLALKNLLHSNPGGLEQALAYQFYEGLEALEWGKPTPLLEPVTTGSHGGLIAIKCELQALLYVEYQIGTGKKKHKAQDEAADAFGISSETIRTWEKRLRTELGTLDFARQCVFARNAGTMNNAHDTNEDSTGHPWREYRYGRTPLLEAAKIYKKIRAE
jgi:hypothetical protein